MPFIINYSSAPCGAGKTHQIILAAQKLVEEGRYVLLLQPTKLLIDRTKADYFDNMPDAPLVKVFHADKSEKMSPSSWLSI
jgi:superfamily II DNA or RNA helicase